MPATTPPDHPDGSPLEGRHVHLLPLGPEYIDDLVEAATGDRSTFAFTTVPRDRDQMAAYIARAEAADRSGTQVPFATWSVAAGRVVGTTRFYDLANWDWSSTYAGAAPPRPGGGEGGREVGPGPEVASIGHTWLGPAAQRSPVNTEAKVLMLDHAFDIWGTRRVRFQTDARNERSRAAIARLGCSFDGVVRADMPGADGTVHDSAVFSLLAEEWPAHRRRLIARL